MESKTVLEWLEGLPEPYRSQAIKNAGTFTVKRNLEKIDSLWLAIYYAFNWDCSSQGYNYWSKIQDKVKSGEIKWSAPNKKETLKTDNMNKTITMSLETAMGIYADLKERSDVASVNFKNWLLENFTKEELEPKPEKKGFTWEKSFDGGGFYFYNKTDAGPIQEVGPNDLPSVDCNRQVFKTEAQAKSALAFAQLTHIVAKYNEGKVEDSEFVYLVGPTTRGLSVITYYKNNYNVAGKGGRPANSIIFKFYTKEDAETSLEVNKELWEQYWMIEKK